jgi:hypothetical protein
MPAFACWDDSGHVAIIDAPTFREAAESYNAEVQWDKQDRTWWDRVQGFELPSAETPAQCTLAELMGCIGVEGETDDEIMQEYNAQPVNVWRESDGTWRVKNGSGEWFSLDDDQADPAAMPSDFMVSQLHIPWDYDTQSHKVAVHPEEPQCVEYGVEHDWQDEGDPWASASGLGVTYSERCKHCGIARITDTGGVDRQDGERGLRAIRYDTRDDSPMDFSDEE